MISPNIPKDFGKAVKQQQKVEQEAAQVFASIFEGCSDFNMFNGDGRYDFSCMFRGKFPVYIEVKEDFAVARTGNVAVDVGSLDIIEADYIMYKLNLRSGPIWTIHTMRHIRLMVEKRWYTRAVSGAGRANRRTVALFDVRTFVGTSFRLPVERVPIMN